MHSTTLNPYFNNYTNSMEQELVESLVIESIGVYGHSCYYLPRTVTSEDQLLNEPSMVVFGTALPIAMYVKNVEGFEGEGDFLSKFGLQIRDSMTLTVARRTFSQRVAAKRSDVLRPREGDAVYFPLTGKLYQIKFVEHEAVFYQMGSLQTYDLKVELFEYSNETFNTGIKVIDTKYMRAHQNIGNTAPEDFDITTIDPLAQNEVFEQEAPAFVDFSESNPFSEGQY